MQGKKPVQKPIVNFPGFEPREPEPVKAKRPPYPRHMPEGVARECWDEVAQDMADAGMYHPACKDLVMAFCIQKALYLEAQGHLEKEGAIRRGKAGDRQNRELHNLWLTVSNHAHDRMVKLGYDLGLNLLARNKVELPAHAKVLVGDKKMTSGMFVKGKKKVTVAASQENGRNKDADERPGRTEH